MEKEVLHFLLGHSHIISSQLFMYLKFNRDKKKKNSYLFLVLQQAQKRKILKLDLLVTRTRITLQTICTAWLVEQPRKKQPTKQQHNSYNTPKIKLNICVGFYFSTKAHIMKNDADEFFHEFVFNKSVLILIYYFCKEKKKLSDNNNKE